MTRLNVLKVFLPSFQLFQTTSAHQYISDLLKIKDVVELQFYNIKLKPCSDQHIFASKGEQFLFYNSSFLIVLLLFFKYLPICLKDSAEGQRQRETENLQQTLCSA